MHVLRFAANDHVLGGTAVSVEAAVRTGTRATAEDLEVGTAAAVDPDPVPLDAISTPRIAGRLTGLPGKADFTVRSDITETPPPVIGLATDRILGQSNSGTGKQ